MRTSESIDLSRAPLLSHLFELRRRLLQSLGVFSVVFIGCYFQAETIYQFLLRPLAEAFGDDHSRRMIYTGLHEAFVTYLKLSLFSALFLTLPFILIQLWRFMAPGLYRHERRATSLLFAATPLLFFAGAALAYYVVFPLAWGFFISFENGGIDGAMPVQLEARVSEYLGLVMQLMLAFGVSFELPVILILLAYTRVISSAQLISGRRYAILGIFTIAALVTPPDLISQIALGTPIVVLYEISIFIIKIIEKNQQEFLQQSIAEK